MKHIRHSLLLLIITASSMAFAANKIPYALIYNGPPTCEGCPEAIAAVAAKASLPVKFVSNSNEIRDSLNDAAIFIIGGTEDDLAPARKIFDQNTIAAIKNYLNDGGNYLGICGGGFLAAEFGIIPANAIDYTDTTKAHLETITWNGKKAVLYFQAGPAFIVNHHAKEDIKVIANYSDGKIAAFETTYGKGKVAVVGPHPEADETWLEEDKIDSSNWRSKQSLAVDLIRQLVEKSK